MASIFDPLLDKRIERALRRGVRSALVGLRPPIVSEARTLASELRRPAARADALRWANDPPGVA